MMSATRTLLDPFEVAGTAGPRPRLQSQTTEWFDRGSLDFLEISFDLQEFNEPPPWTPEPVDRRWRARGWADDY